MNKETKKNKNETIKLQEIDSWFWNENVKGKKLMEYLLKYIGDSALRYIDLDIRLGKVSERDRENYKKIFRYTWELKELLDIKENIFNETGMEKDIIYWKIEDEIKTKKLGLKYLKNKQDKKERLTEIKKLESWTSYPYDNEKEIKEYLETING